MGWFRQRKTRRAAQRMHRIILSKARDPQPFQAGLVPDTLEGRFHMVTLVSAITIRALRTDGATSNALIERLNDEIFSGFDHALREEGVGDSSIARRIRKMGETYVGLARAVDAAFDSETIARDLANVLSRNAVTKPAQAPDLAALLISFSDQLAKHVPAQGLATEVGEPS